jgi:hypothetical protein
MIPALGLSSCSKCDGSAWVAEDAPMGVSASAPDGRAPVFGATGVLEVTSRWAPSRLEAQDTISQEVEIADMGLTHVPPFNINAVLAADSLEKTTSADLSPICTLLTWPQNETANAGRVSALLIPDGTRRVTTHGSRRAFPGSFQERDQRPRGGEIGQRRITITIRFGQRHRKGHLRVRRIQTCL